MPRTGLPPIGKPRLWAPWGRIGELGLAVWIHFEPRYAPGLGPPIREFPAKPVVIEHPGTFRRAPEEYAAALGRARRLTRS